MTPLLISCIIPVFNGERYLREAIDSVLAQTYRTLDVIVVDDGSTDGSAQIAESFGASVRVIAQSNQGHAAARNTGVQHARGQLLAFLDADDLWHPEKLERQMRLLEQHPNAGGCVAHVRNFWQDPRLQEQAERKAVRGVQGIPGFSPPNLLAHRWIFDRVGLFDVSLGHADDTEWFLRVRAAGIAIELHPDVLGFRRMHDSNRSSELASDSVDEYLHLLKRHLDKRRQK
jgi:glycosyltransferase involved in cell wall biosynthesis